MMGDGGGDDGVRERSPLHEIGERAWPPPGDDYAGDSRAKFRLRVGRRTAASASHNGGQPQRGPLVRCPVLPPPPFPPASRAELGICLLFQHTLYTVGCVCGGWGVCECVLEFENRSWPSKRGPLMRRNHTYRIII